MFKKKIALKHKNKIRAKCQTQELAGHSLWGVGGSRPSTSGGFASTADLIMVVMARGKFSKSASQGWKHLKSPQNPSGGGVGVGLQAGLPGEGSRDPRFGLYRRGHGDSSAEKRRQTRRQMRLRQPRPPRCPSVGTQTNGHGQTDRPVPGHTPCQPGSPPKPGTATKSLLLPLRRYLPRRFVTSRDKWAALAKPGLAKPASRAGLCSSSSSAPSDETA